jgi:hypothetical protein
MAIRGLADVEGSKLGGERHPTPAKSIIDDAGCTASLREPFLPRFRHGWRAAGECSKTRTASPAGASAAGNGKVSAEADRMPGPWRRVEASRRRCLRNPGVRAGAIQTDPTGASETGLRVL